MEFSGSDIANQVIATIVAAAILANISVLIKRFPKLGLSLAAVFLLFGQVLLVKLCSRWLIDSMLIRSNRIGAFHIFFDPDLLNVLDSRRTLLNAKDSRVQARQPVLNNSAELVRALGGGWHNQSGV